MDESFYETFEEVVDHVDRMNMKGIWNCHSFEDHDLATDLRFVLHNNKVRCDFSKTVF